MVDEVVPRRPRLLVGLLSLLLLVVLATVLILFHDRRDAAGVEAKRPADIGAEGWADDSAGGAVVAARTAARTYFTLGFSSIKADMDAMRALGTPDFVDDYDARAQALAARIAEDRLVLSAALPRDGAATEYLVTDRAQVLVSVDVTTSRGGEDRLTRYRTRIALTLVDGEWLVSSLDEVR